MTTGVAGGAAIPSTSTAALQPASGNLFEPSLGTIHDEAGQQSATASAALLDAEATNGAKLPPATSTTTIVDEDLLKFSRKLSQSLSMSEAALECDYDDEDYTPHFQRVYISGDDNTGVSLVFFSLLWPFFFALIEDQDR